MQAIIFIGVQASGKSTFYAERFFHTHVRINLDMLRTRNRERRLLEFCLETGQPFVVDNTNPTREDRARYIGKALAAGFTVIGYCFGSELADALARNATREGSARIPDAGVRDAFRRLELPRIDEGFNALYAVRMAEVRDGAASGFIVEEWNDVI